MASTHIRPRLPIPSLRQTVDRYLASIVPLLQDDEAQGGQKAEDAFKAHMARAREFESGAGLLLQERLHGARVPPGRRTVQLVELS